MLGVIFREGAKTEHMRDWKARTTFGVRKIDNLSHIFMLKNTDIYHFQSKEVYLDSMTTILGVRQY